MNITGCGELWFVNAHGDNNVGQYTYKFTADLRLSQREDGLRPIGLEPLILEKLPGGVGFRSCAEMAVVFW